MKMTIPVGISGLSDREAAARQAAGQGNQVQVKTSRTYQEILRDNLFTFINGAYFFISLVLIALGRPSDVVMIAVVVLLNVVVNLVQEIRAKKKLDQIALLTRPTACVVRDGQERTLDPADIVVGDVLILKPGDQVVVDGSVLQSSDLKLDESLLTGESDLIPKQPGDPVYSGSFCVHGTGYFEVEKVGSDSFANQITARARSFQRTVTPLQREINLVIRLLLAIAILLGLFVMFRTLVGLLSFNSAVTQIAVITGLVPIGLYFMVTLSYAIGAVRMAQKSALIQSANAVESLSNVDVMCLDKTGTLTANRILLDAVYPAGMSEAHLRRILGDFVASASFSNKTSEAIATALPGQQRPLAAEVPFASSYKWSAIAFADEVGTYVLGAPEILSQAIALPEEFHQHIQSGADRGLRMLLFAHAPSSRPNYTAAGDPQLPDNLHPIGLLQFSDELRPDAYATLQKFMQAGIQVKIISGDNPLTVAALAKQAGLPQDIQAVSGQDLAQMSAAEFTQTALERTVFGRITPDQKASLVQAFQRQGYYVAMMGDGVNDVLSLKQAEVGVAMESGSQATRGVADIVLLQDSFNALPDIFLEGQRIRNGIEDITKLFLVRVCSFALVIIAVGMITFTFPLTIKNSVIVTLLAVGIPTYFVTIWAKPSRVERGAIVPKMLNFIVPAALTLAIASLAVYLSFLFAYTLPIVDLLQGETTLQELQEIVLRSGKLRNAISMAQSALVTMAVLGSLLLIPFLKPPTPAWVGCEPLSGDRRYSILAFTLIAAYIGVLTVPALRHSFELQALSLPENLMIGLAAMLWCLVLRFVWRRQILEQFIGIKLQ